MQERKCVLQGRSHDLSVEGMAIYIPAELEAGQSVQVEFTIPETNQRLGVHAVIRNSKGFRRGIEFRDLTPLDLAALHRQCEALSRSA
jgi:uncharacterized membrane protein